MKKQILAALLCLSMNLHSQETAIVTGANRGIGLGFVSELLKRNYQVIATYRNEGSLTHLNSLKTQYPETLTLYQLDVTDQDGIRQFAATVKAVDLLVL